MFLTRTTLIVFFSMFYLLVSLLWLSLAVQVIDWKDSCCWWC